MPQPPTLIIMYKTFTFVCILFYLIQGMTTGTTSYGFTVTAYVCMLMGSICRIAVQINEFAKASISAGSIVPFIPLILMIFTGGMLLYLTIAYKSRIVEGHVSSGYYTFRGIVILLWLLQLYLMNQPPTSVMTLALIFIGLLTIVSVISICTILIYFTTDGFSSGSTGLLRGGSGCSSSCSLAPIQVSA
jgi:hypothetical protein